MPIPFEVATDDVRMNAILVTVDSSSKEAERIERITVKAEFVDAAGYDADDGKPEYFNNNL